MPPDIRYTTLSPAKLNPNLFRPYEPPARGQFQLGLKLVAFPDFHHTSQDLLVAAACFLTGLFTHPDIRPHLFHGTPQTDQAVIDNFLLPITVDYLSCHYFFIVYAQNLLPRAVLGFINLKPDPVDPTHFKTGTVIYPNYWGNGIGSWARSWTELVAIECGAKKLTSIVGPNNTASHALTQKRGFKPTGEFVADSTLPPELQVVNRVVYTKTL